MENIAVESARTSFQKDQLYRRWATVHVGVYVPQTEDTPPNQYLSHIEDQNITTPGGSALTLMNPGLYDRAGPRAGRRTL